MKRLTGLALSTAILFLLGACSIGSSIQPEPTATPENQATASEPSSTPTTTLSNGQTGPLTLRIWVPPAFSPDPANEAGALLKARLDEFVLLHPGVRVTVRIKAETGTGGMIRSLEAMSVAVPDALPDLILASRPELERAASSGLLDSYSDLGQGWYGFAPGLSQYASQVIGLPFAADALVLLYRADTLSDPPSDWDRTLDFKSPLLFAAGDHWSLFTLALYLSAGGTFMDESGNPAINPFNMAEVFQYYRQGHEVGIFHDWMAGLEGQEDVYKSLQAGSAPAGIVWASNVLGNRDADFQVTGIPTQGGESITIATGWLWAMSNPDSPHHQISEELARFLTEAEFMGEWTLAAGYLPVRPESLAAWPERSDTAFAGRVLLSAAPIPPLDILETSGPLIRDTLKDLWEGNVTLMDAAEGVLP